MSTLSSAFSSLWSNNTLATGSGRVELPLEKNEPLGTDTEKCELRIEGMTCGSCVEVSIHTQQLCLTLFPFQPLL
jgi:P-type Cu+ transporter